MPTEFVLDASAAAKLFRVEPESAALRAWFEEALAKDARFLVPAIFAFEIRNLAVRTVREGALAGPDEASQATEATLQLVDEVDVKPADEIRLALRHNLTTYDAAYLAVAGRNRTLVTYDAALSRAATRHVSPGAG